MSFCLVCLANSAWAHLATAPPTSRVTNTEEWVLDPVKMNPFFEILKIVVQSSLYQEECCEVVQEAAESGGG